MWQRMPIMHGAKPSVKLRPRCWVSRPMDVLAAKAVKTLCVYLRCLAPTLRSRSGRVEKKAERRASHR